LKGPLRRAFFIGRLSRAETSWGPGVKIDPQTVMGGSFCVSFLRIENAPRKRGVFVGVF